MIGRALPALLAVLVVAPAASASASPGSHHVARMVERGAAARFVSESQPQVSATCHRRGTRRYKCHFAISSGDSAFAGRVRVRILHRGGVRMRFGQLQLGGFASSGCTPHPGFVVSQTHAEGLGDVPGTSVPAESCTSPSL